MTITERERQEALRYRRNGLRHRVYTKAYRDALRNGADLLTARGAGREASHLALAKFDAENSVDA